MLAGTATRQPSPSRPRRLPGGRLLLAVPAALIFLLLFVFPLVRLIVASFTSAKGFTLEYYAQSLDPAQDLFLTVIIRTAFIALLVTVACVVLGYAVSYAAVALPGAWGVVLVGIVCLPFFTSALVRTYSWQVILAGNGPINQLLLSSGIVKAPLSLVYNDIGVVIGMTQVLLPMMVFPLYGAMRAVDPGVVAAARNLGSSRFRAWRTVFLPLSAPGLAAGAALVFIVALGYYTTPVLLQGASTPMFAQRMDTLAGMPGNIPLIAAQSALVLIACAVLLLVFRHPLGLVAGKSRRTRSRSTRQMRVLTPDWLSTIGHRAERIVDALGRALFWPLVAVLAGLAVTMSVGPMIVVAMVGFSDSSFLQFPPEGFSMRWYEAVFEDPRWIDALGLSVQVSAIAAAIVVVAAAAASFLIARSGRPFVSATAYALLVAPLVVPQIVVAIAMLSYFINIGLNGTAMALVLGYLVITLPMAIILLTTAFRGLDPLFERASASLGASPLRTATRVIFPLITPAMIGALLFAFVTAFSDLVMAQFLGGVTAQSLERLIYQDIRESVSPEVAAIGTLLILAVLLLGACAIATQTIYSRRLRSAIR